MLCYYELCDVITLHNKVEEHATTTYKRVPRSKNLIVIVALRKKLEHQLEHLKIVFRFT